MLASRESGHCVTTEVPPKLAATDTNRHECTKSYCCKEQSDAGALAPFNARVHAWAARANVLACTQVMRTARYSYCIQVKDSRIDICQLCDGAFLCTTHAGSVGLPEGRWCTGLPATYATYTPHELKVH